MWLARTLSKQAAPAPAPETPKKAAKISLSERKKELLNKMVDLGCCYWDHHLSPPLEFFPDVLPIATEFDEQSLPRFKKTTHKTVSFFLQGELKEWSNVLKIALETHQFTKCKVFVSLDKEAHHTDGPPMDIFGFYEKLIAECMTCEDCTEPEVKIEYLPLVFEEMIQEVFLLPACSDCFPVNAEFISDVDGSIDVERVDRKTKRNLKTLVHSLASLMSVFDIRPEYYALGATSLLVAEELSKTTFSLTTSASPASVIVIDRTLDLVGSTMTTTNENIMDELYQTLDDKQDVKDDLNRYFDSQIGPTLPLLVNNNLVAKMYKMENSKFASNNMLPSLSLPCSGVGSVGGSSDGTTISMKNVFILQKPKYAVNEVKKQLIEIASESSSSSDKENMVSIDLKMNTDAMLKALIDQPSKEILCKHYETIAYTSLQSALQPQNNNSERRTVASLSKLIVSSVGLEQNSLQQLLNHIRDPITSKKTNSSLIECGKSGVLPPNKILELALLCLSLQGDGSYSKSEDDLILLSETVVHYLINFSIDKSDEPYFLQELLPLFVKHQNNLKSSDSQQQPDKKKQVTQQLQMVLTDKLNRIIVNKLRHLSTLRKNYQEYNKLYTQAGSISNYVSLTKQIVNDLLINNQRKMSDLKRVTSSLTGMLTHSFSRFGFQKQPRPSDNKTIVIFVIGGITCEEISQIKELISKSTDQEYQILIGSTMIATPSKIAQLFYT
eukprot:TRINITY_DN1115_c3_g1_i2.p1 TRINITY_DN1115_c3_g1~~TRINITY_DN1115_c3_g1_i2.p1  ORF type:complete len:725 (-),score=175.54 TRINITY_DN1115_c3_g1_i2:56-2230(-)